MKLAASLLQGDRKSWRRAAVAVAGAQARASLPAASRLTPLGGGRRRWVHLESCHAEYPGEKPSPGSGGKGGERRIPPPACSTATGSITRGWQPRKRRARSPPKRKVVALEALGAVKAFGRSGTTLD